MGCLNTRPGSRTGCVYSPVNQRCWHHVQLGSYTMGICGLVMGAHAEVPYHFKSQSLHQTSQASITIRKQAYYSYLEMSTPGFVFAMDSPTPVPSTMHQLQESKHT